MKIAIACCGLGHVRRGVEVWADDLARLLYGNGIDVTLFKGGGRVERPYEVVVPCIKRDSHAAKWLTKWRLRGIWRTPFTAPYPLESWTFALNLKPYLKEKYDIVNVQDPLVARHLLRWKKKGNICPEVVFSNGTEADLDFIKTFDFIQELDSYDVENLVKAGHDRRSIYVVPNFVDTDVFNPGDKVGERLRLGIPGDAYVVLSVAAIERGFKRIDYIIKEFAVFRKTYRGKALLVLAGARTDDTEELKRMAASLIGNDVRFMENLSHADMAGVYRIADVFTFCVTHGIYGIALAEAAATGLPCIVHDWQRVKWVAGPQAQVMDLTREGALASGIERLSDPVLRAQVSKATRKWAEESLSGKNVVKEYIRMYRDILSR